LRDAPSFATLSILSPCGAKGSETVMQVAASSRRLATCRPGIYLAALALAALASACGADAGGTSKRQDISDDAPADAGDGSFQDTALVDIDTGEVRDAEDGDGGPPCPGCFGSPCDDNAECNSGWCVPGPSEAGGSVCTKTCQDECPSGFSCRPISTSGADVAFICIYDHTVYCAPCDDASDCLDPLAPNDGARCIAAGDGLGAFCATPCRSDAECPIGSACDVVADGASESSVCRPAPIEGEPTPLCECSFWASERRASTACTTRNARGTCAGRRACGDDDDMLGACDAPAAIAELCNGADDDCDGATDEDFPQLGQACDSDSDPDDCELGTLACGPDGTVTCQGDRAAGTTEVCNGRDDDCDGETDEDPPDDGEPCDGDDSDDCLDDIVRCSGSVNICVDAGVPVVEACNGVDDDCDGLTDRDDGDLTGPRCEGAKGVCAAVTTPARLCDRGAWAGCDAEAFAASPDYEAGRELSCDGRDNDCDGQSDEDFVLVQLDDRRVTGVGVACGAGECAGGTTGCNASGDGLVCDGETLTVPERCNGKDDDCDGLTDAADPTLAIVECELQLGVCAGASKPTAICDQDGFSDCTAGIYTGHAASYQDESELSCDGLDNDCDAGTDEDFVTSLPNGTTVVGVGKPCGVGVCAGGFTVCNADKSGAHCSSAVNARAEVCNGLDDDCDGLTDAADPDLARPACEKQAGLCAGTQKPMSLCMAGSWKPCGTPEYDAHDAAYEPTAESRCDGRDDDCDGQVDDDFDLTGPDGARVRGVGSACGTGGCAGGTARCTDDDRGIECSSSGSALPEVCDGSDNDCDGKTDAADDGLDRVVCSSQLGLCQGALTLPERCVAGSWQACISADYDVHAPAYEATAEAACDGVDEDCNGLTDEDFTLTLADGMAVVGTGKSCGSGECAGGTTACAAGGGMVCATGGNAAAEVCDGVDNDCDGKTDAADPDLVRILCQEQRGICDGALRPIDKCVAGGWLPCGGADYEARDARYEANRESLCDGLDNDCDGNKDEDFAMIDRGGSTISGAGKSCGTGRCAGGVTVCNGSGDTIVCPGDANNGTEVCNFMDDDCDGLADAADPDLVLAPCEETRGVCAGATHRPEACSGAQWSACQASDYTRHDARFEAASETRCDSLDNDCDGNRDEDISDTFGDGSIVTGVGASCGTGACEGGTTACNGSGDGLVCSGEAAIAIEECNGIDDDCDGKTDAADLSLEPILCQNQNGACVGAARPASLCSGGQWSACGIDIYAANDDRFEVANEVSCDGVDNDCDSRSDEDFGLTLADGNTVRGVGTSCGTGVCAGGSLVCNAQGSGVTCPSEARASAEVCNGDDDDCDGRVDAADTDLVIVPCERTTGACVGADKPASLCRNGDWTACTTADYSAHSALYDPGSELRCDGFDGDCDGGTDEDFGLTLLDGRQVSGLAVSCGTGECAGGATRCNGPGNAIECSSEGAATAEICNGDDDDCDGKVDGADPSLLREACANQMGLCVGAQKLPERCVGGTWQACGTADYKANTAAYNAGSELACDARDEDCDGQSDEDFAWSDPAGATFHIGEDCGKGLCVGGRVVCSGGAAVSCSTANKAVTELCDNLDQDCDGVPDDGCDDDGDDYCDVAMGTSGLPEVCPRGGGDCDDLAATRYPMAPELCNNIDEDCDLSVDEAYSDCLKGSCDVSGAGYAAIAVDLCTAGRCVRPAAASCGLYACNGGGVAGDVCGTSCANDDHCVAAAHCDQTDGKCKPDVADGTGCAEDSDCVGGHCQNNFCCASGDCCNSATDCPLASWTTAPGCGTSTTCQGTRQDRECSAAKMCKKSAPIADDRACTSGTQAITCPAGYPPRFCDGGADQSAPSCPATCNSDAQCSAGYHCDGTCVPNLPDGGSCDEASDCAGGRCQNLYCCASGDCCATAADCADATWSEAATCDTASVCDGQRVDKLCGDGARCVKSAPVDDDSACGAGVVANTCGDYTSVTCTGAANQASAPACPTSCINDSQCDPSAHCDGTCVPDVADGTGCDEASDCTSGHCQNGFCCGGPNNDCCASASDCPASYASAPACVDPARCDGLRSVATCPPATRICGTQPGVPDDRACGPTTEASNCDLYPSVYCSGAATQDPTRPTCATSCTTDASCDEDAYCKAGTPKRCTADEPDGGQCTSDAQCQSEHCDNGFCCGYGACCSNTSDCPVAAFTEASTCTTPGGCQGARRDPLCGGDKICVINPAPTPDDSGCGGIEANACGDYPAIVCTSGTNQTPRSCPTSCNNDSECDGPAYCDLATRTCKPDQPAGQQCDPEPCAAGLFCVDGVCCRTACTGDCRRCDLTNDGTCTNTAAQSDPDQDCDGFDCSGQTSYYFGFVGDTCFAKAPIEDADAACGANGQCDTRPNLCTAQSLQGGAVVSCDDTCQDPVPNTCTGTTLGSCVNVNPGNIMCGLGICQRIVPRCVNGGDNTCTPGPAGPKEICDGLDNDCDGKTDGADDDLEIPKCGKQSGVCLDAKTPVDRCRGVAGWDPCSDADYALPSQPQGSFYNAGSERACDGRDNDCDAATDEDFAWQGPNGQTYTGVGTLCGVGGCSDAATKTVCTGGNAITCQYAAGHSPTSETCSLPGGATRDDDCDGLVDANDPSLTLKLCQQQEGVCSQASNERSDCVNGAWNACDSADYQRNAGTRFDSTYKTHPEVLCDGFDNDCGNGIDEDFAWVGPDNVTYQGAGTACGVGRCANAATITVCTGGNATTCQYAANFDPLPAEVCSLVRGSPQDDDCDGKTDQDDPSLTLASCGTQVGVCGGSTNEATDCVNGVWAACDAADYDRRAVALGTRYTPSREGTGSGSQLATCDTFDNDCDSLTDEDFTMVGLSGANYSGTNTLCGVGLCSDNGTRTACNAGRTALQCNYAAGRGPIQEVCSRDAANQPIDDDCDGLLDAADATLQLGNPCQNQTGVCGGASNDAGDCVAGAWQACDANDYDRRAIARVPSTRYTWSLVNNVVVAKEGTGSGSQLTTCDGLDNDCDGPTDEDFTMTGLSGATYAGVGTLCGVGRCSDPLTKTACTAAKSATECLYAVNRSAIPEDCGGGDDDCDGLVDGNDIVDANLDLCGLQAGVCSGKKVTRDLCLGNGTWAACGATQYGVDYESSETLCDNKDNDCDGVTETSEGPALAQPFCDKHPAGVCLNKKKPNSLCANGSWGVCPATTTYYGTSFNSDDIPEPTLTDANCDGIDGTISNALFVSPLGSGTACSMATPCALATALAMTTSTQHIYLRPGDYNAVSASWQVARVVQIYGGFGSDAAWTRVADRAGNQAKIKGGGTFGGQYITIRVAPSSGTLGSAASPVKFVDLYVEGFDVPAGNDGKSSYGLYAKNAFVEVNRCTVTGRNGRIGSAGVAGATPGGTASGGGGGGNPQQPGGCSGSRPNNGGGNATNTCSGGSRDRTSGGGGSGGAMDTNCPFSLDATRGLDGGNAAYFFASSWGYRGGGGAANLNPIGGTSGAGGGGNSGYPGEAGIGGAAAANGLGFLSGDFWSGHTGGTGNLGDHGGGGGGGGGSGGSDNGADSYGAGGGGGGAGGCRATGGGAGGLPGGGSFAIFGVDARLTVYATAFFLGSGGSGGAGGLGRAGQAGGAGGSGGVQQNDSGAGGGGGAGGAGGPSGGGGGGAGGGSYGIGWWSSGGSNGSLTAGTGALVNTFGAGIGGGGGGGGAISGGNAGSTGPVGATGQTIQF